MKRIKRYLKVILGCLLISATLNIFFKGQDILPSGIFGFTILYNSKVYMPLHIVILLTNVFFLVLAYLLLSKNKIKRMILPFALIPIFTYLTKDLNSIIDLSNIDKILISLYGGVLLGLGFKLIYKENMYPSASDVITNITKKIDVTKKNIPIYFLDFFWIVVAIFLYGFENSMYTSLAIVITEIISKRATLGISDAKVFYIITKKDKEIRDFIIDELGYELTTFDVKGGFLKAKSKVIMCAIPTKDYYKLKEGVKTIDSHAFISITDSYEVINPNLSISQKEKTK